MIGSSFDQGGAVLGFMGNSDWHDMSDYLVHLTDASHSKQF